MAKSTATKKAPSKTEIFASIADSTELSKKQVAAVFEALSAEIKKALTQIVAFAVKVPVGFFLQEFFPGIHSAPRHVEPFRSFLPESGAR